jgi:uncharacterized protein YdhG (YjbR/CyaY superfamily)
MKQKTVRIENFNAYIADYPGPVQKLLKQMRSIIRKAAPTADEVISYNMPAYKFHGTLVYFAAHTSHVGLYPMASGIEKFRKEITAFKHASGSVQFPFGKALPVSLITKIVKFRVKENLEKAQMKAALKKRNSVRIKR